MKVNIKKLAVSAMLTAVAVSLSGFSIPIGASKCFPVQHLANVLAGLTEEAAVKALSAHGLCGELAAEETAKRGGGTGTFRMYLLDKMSLLDDGTLERGKKIEIR